MSQEATIFPVKDAYWYRQSSRVGSQGDAEYKAPNAPFGARFTYYMSEKLNSLKDLRKKREKTNTDFPGWEALEKEINQDQPQVLLIIKDVNGKVVNTVRGTNRKGFNRVNWRLNYPNKGGERLNGRGDGIGGGFIMATPGTYTVTLVKRVDGITTELQGPTSFNVIPMYEGALPRKSYNEMNQFREDVDAFLQDLTATNMMMETQMKKIAAMKRSANKTTAPNDAILKEINAARIQLLAVQKELDGDSVKGQVGEKSNPTANDGGGISWRAFGNTYGPTGTHKGLLNRVKSQLRKVKVKLNKLAGSTLPAIESRLEQAGAPWIEGQGLIKN